MTLINVTDISITSFEKIKRKERIFSHCSDIIVVCKMVGGLLVFHREDNVIARA